MTVLSIERIDHPLIQALDLEARSGDRITVAGSSGSGKTVFLKCLADLLPGHHQIRLDDTDLRAMAAHQWRRQVMYVSGESAWWAPRVVDHFPAESSFPLSSVLLDDSLWERPPHKLSSGQRQRFALLRAMALKPPVLLLDEPTANLDDTATLAVEKLLEDWSQAGGVLIFTSHNVQQRMRLATRRWLVRDGKIEETPA